MPSKATYLTIVNDTSMAMTIAVTETDNYDWDGSSRPDHNFQNVTIAAHSSVKNREELNYYAKSAWYRMTITFTNGQKITFRNDQQDAFKDLNRMYQCNSGYLVWQLSGNDNNQMTISPYSAWMHDNLDLLGGRDLRQICMPGSHDAGMDKNVNGTIAPDCAVVTQAMPISGQLACGVRYFDLRVIIGSGTYHTGHYDDSTHLGGRGESFEEIINEVNDFTAYTRELVILQLSHSMDTDHDYAAFTTAQWNGLLDLLTAKMKHLYLTTAADLTSLTLRDYIGTGPAVVIFVGDKTSINFANYPTIYAGSKFPMFDSYAHSDDVNVMVSDQLNKMHVNKTYPDAKLFLLSWTLTQTTFGATTCLVDSSKSIKSLAAQANARLNDILPACTPYSFPNIILLDWIYPTLPFLNIAMTINTTIIDAWFRLVNKQRQTTGQPYLDAGSDKMYMSNYQSDYTLWKLQPVQDKWFRLVNKGHQLHSLPLYMDGGGSQNTVYMSNFSDSPCVQWSFNSTSPWFKIICKDHQDKGSKLYLDANSASNPIYTTDYDSLYTYWKFEYVH